MNDESERSLRKFSTYHLLIASIISFAVGGAAFGLVPNIIPKNQCENLRNQMQMDEANLHQLWDKYQTTRQQVIDANRPNYPDAASKTIGQRLRPLFESNLKELTEMSKHPECLNDPKVVLDRINKVKQSIPIVEKITDLDFALVDPYSKVGTFVNLLKEK